MRELDRTSDRDEPFAASWGQGRRLEFIEFRLIWDGRINRAQLVEFFGTSMQQASLDLARYMNLAPGNLDYDRSDKVYKASATFSPVLTHTDAQGFLRQLSESTESHGTPSFIGWRPPHDSIVYPTRSITPEVLMRVIWAIRDRQDIEVTYQSMRRPAATRRWIAPHAIAFDGSRWHVRAWCHENVYFKDFVLARIQQIRGTRESAIDAQRDRRWHSFTTVDVRARSDLTEGQRLAVEAEFGMHTGLLKLRVREALVHYLVRLLRIDGGPQMSDGQTLEWVNAEELAPLITEARSR